MPSDSGHSIEHSTNEAEERLLALEGDTADPLQGLMPVGPLVESANAIITPIPDPITPMPEVEDDGEVGDTPNPAQGLQPVEGRPQGSPLPYTDTSVLQMYAPHSTLLIDALRKQRLRKIMLRRYSRNQLRAVRARERRTNCRLWITIASTTLALLVVFLSVGSTAGYVSYRFVHTTQITFQHSVVTLPDLLPLDNLKIYDSKGVLIDQLTDNGIQTSVTFDQVAPIMTDATVATEDKNFWSNQGIDVVGIIRALLTNLESGRVVEGGSTITQQLIKNLS